MSNNGELNLKLREVYAMDVHALKSLLKSLGAMIKPLNELVGVKLTNPDALSEIAKHLRKGLLIDMVQLRSRLDEASDLVKGLQEQRAAAFTPILSEYIRMLQSEGVEVRETSTGWRIGILELQIDPENGTTRMAYNREPLTKWVSVSDTDGFVQLGKEAHQELTRWSIPDDIVLDTMHAAYEISLSSARTRPALIPMIEFYKGVRHIQVRQRLHSEGPQADLSPCKLPVASFLYALDRYRVLSCNLPLTERLGFQTGSSQEVAQKKGFIINGLDAFSEYKVVCYVVRMEP